MLCEAVGSRRHARNRTATTSATLAFLKTDDTERIVDREVKRDRRPLPILVEHELRLGRATAGKRSRQLESPVVLVAAKHLPATFLVVPDAPYPVATTELGRQLSGCLVQRNDARAFRRRVTHCVPDGLRRFASVRRIRAAAAEVEHGPARRHLHPAVRFGWVCSSVARSPGAIEFKDREPWPITQTNDRPFHAGARFFPQDAGRAVRN